jgi:RNA polymerase sigma factor (sigma-70 family)
MVESVKGMIIEMAVRYSPEGSDREDLIMAGWQAAAEAARTYDPSKGKYSTWAYWKIRQGMQTQMRLRWVTSASYWVRGMHGDEEREPIFEETCEDPRPTPLEELCNEERASEAHYALALLSKRFSKSEIKAICMYFLDGRGIRSIAKVVRHPQALVCRARQAMAEVRASLQVAEMEEVSAESSESSEAA